VIPWVDGLLQDWGRHVAQRPSGLPSQSAFMSALTARARSAQVIPASMMTEAQILAADKAWRALEAPYPREHQVIFARYVLRMSERQIARSLNLAHKGLVRESLAVGHGLIAFRIDKPEIGRHIPA
jgi:hypothetical protein